LGLDEEFDGIVAVGGVVAVFELGGDVGVVALVGHVEVAVVAEEPGDGLLRGSFLERPGKTNSMGAAARQAASSTLPSMAIGKQHVDFIAEGLRAATAANRMTRRVLH
jgi:hypothetical protein